MLLDLEIVTSNNDGEGGEKLQSRCLITFYGRYFEILGPTQKKPWAKWPANNVAN